MNDEIKEKVNAIKKTILSQPKSAKDYYSKGLYLDSIEDLRGALHHYNQALEHDSALKEAYYERGIIKVKLEDFSGAINDFNKVLHLDIQYGDAYYQRALIRAKYNDYSGACLDFQQAMKFGVVENKQFMDDHCR